MTDMRGKACLFFDGHVGKEGSLDGHVDSFEMVHKVIPTFSTPDPSSFPPFWKFSDGPHARPCLLDNARNEWWFHPKVIDRLVNRNECHLGNG
jgi:prepilin-type processing-associated H-X9-DG protein